jgi:hypothetical protein
MKRSRDHAGAGRDIEHELARFRIDRRHEGAAPAGILAEGEDRRDPIVRASDAGEDPRRVRRWLYGAKSFSPSSTAIALER